MKYLVGVLALAAICAAEPEADPLYALYAPYLRPYYASGYAGPLPGHSYQAVHRLHKREAEADALYSLYAPYLRPYYASGYAGPLPGHSYQAVHRLHKREAEADADAVSFLSAYPPPAFLPSTVGTIVQAAHPVFTAPIVKSVVEAPAVVTYAPAPVPAPFAVVGLGPHDCVTEGGCALRTALDTGLPAVTVGSTTIAGRKRREADAEPKADAEADPALLYNNFYGYHPYGYAAHPYAYYAGYNPYLAAPVVATNVPAPVVAKTVVPAPVAPVRVPVVATEAKEVTYTHLGAHPIPATTVVQSESRLVY